MAALLCVVLAFLAGSIPFGVLIGRTFFQIDPRAHGSGNIGAANALRTLGKGGAAAVLVLDALKGGAAAALGIAVGGTALGAACGFAAIAGHCFSPWLGWRGGKGVATSLGVVFALSWPAGLAFVIVWSTFVGAFGFSSLGSLAASIAAPFALWFMIGGNGLAYGLASAALIAFTHRTNISRLLTGTENRLSFGRTKRAEDESSSGAT